MPGVEEIHSLSASLFTLLVPEQQKEIMANFEHQPATRRDFSITHIVYRCSL